MRRIRTDDLDNSIKKLEDLLEKDGEFFDISNTLRLILSDLDEIKLGRKLEKLLNRVYIQLDEYIEAEEE